MADNNTFVLFEEIKNKLEAIYKEVRELKEKDISSVSLPTPTIPAQSNEQQDQERCSNNMSRKRRRYSISI